MNCSCKQKREKTPYSNRINLAAYQLTEFDNKAFLYECMLEVYINLRYN